MKNERKWKVYIHENKINGKMYCGITSRTLNRRWRNGNGYKGQIFYNAIKKHGWNSFHHYVIADKLTEDEASKMELDFIKTWNLRDREYGYNIAEGGYTGGTKSIRVLCDNIIFNSIKECEEFYNDYNLGSYLNKRATMPKKYHLKGLRYLDKQIDNYKVRDESKLEKVVIYDGLEFKNPKMFSDRYNLCYGSVKGWLNGRDPMPEKWFNKGLRYKYFKTNIHPQIGNSEGNNHNAKTVICDNMVFGSATQCARYYNINEGTMNNWLRGINHMPKEFYDKGLRYQNNVYKILPQKGQCGGNNPRAKKVLYMNTIYDSAKECSEQLSINVGTLRAWLQGKNRMPQKYIDLGLRYATEEDLKLYKEVC